MSTAAHDLTLHPAETRWTDTGLAHALSERGGVGPCAGAVLGRGANRVVVADPSDPACCLKMELPVSLRTAVGMRARLRRRLGRVFPRLGENATELRAWCRLSASLGPEMLAGRIAESLEIVHGPAGSALRCAMVIDDDGRPAQSLHALMGAPGLFTADALCAAVDDFERWLHRHAIPLLDLNAGNFVVAGTHEPRLVCVDAKSLLAGKELLPVSRWIPALRRRKIARRAERLRQRIRAELGTPVNLR
ncbi:YrbL family protein [Marilutibacter penaei]|uniref:YrbL family protein n=1 Tax=Marilutibacter penaei TaxID=2759900 RepID=UPI001FEB5221|nr:YrbL family protein [Lysobacter penaei]